MNNKVNIWAAVKVVRPKHWFRDLSGQLVEVARRYQLCKGFKTYREAFEQRKVERQSNPNLSFYPDSAPDGIQQIS